MILLNIAPYWKICMNAITKIIRHLLLFTNLNKNPVELVNSFIKTKAIKRIYMKMLKFKIKQNEKVNKMKLNKRFSKTIQITEYFNGIIVKGNVTVALRWNGNSETGNKEAKLNTWCWGKNDSLARVKDLTRPLLDLVEGEKDEIVEKTHK